MLTAHVPWRERLFISDEYFALFVAQVISAMGDWIGFFAIAELASTISGSPETSVALVLTARVAPGLFLAPVMGVIVDRFDKKILMRIADLSRAAVFCILPFVHTVFGLVLASLALEFFTLLWSPAKEALVPSLVPRERLTSANSLGVLAAYGTMPIAGLFKYGLQQANDALAGVSWLQPLQFGNTQALAFYVDALSFLAVAFIVWRFIKTPGTVGLTSRAARMAGSDGDSEAILGEDPPSTIAAIKEGWQYIFVNPVVRAVNLGLATALMGGAMLIPLGPIFADKIIGSADTFSLFITSMGFGVAAGVGLLTAFQQRIPKERVFVAAVFFGGVSLGFAVAMSSFWLAAIGTFALGVCAGGVYVLGFTLLHEHTDDDMRGRIFTTLLTLVRLCVLGAIALGPLIAAVLEPLAKRWFPPPAGSDIPEVRLLGVHLAVPGVRLTLWLASVVIMGASVLAARSLRMGFRENLASFAPRALSGDSE